MNRFLFLLLAVSFADLSLLHGRSSSQTYSDNKQWRVKKKSPWWYNVQQYGAKADGITDNRKAFLAAWVAACSSTHTSVIYVPKGNFLLGPVSFKGPCNNDGIMMQIIGNLIAPTDTSLWKGENSGYWLNFNYVDHLTVEGTGRLDGQGASWWNSMCPNDVCHGGPTTLLFSNANNTVVRQITSINSKHFHILFEGCKNVTAEGLTMEAPGDSPNTDGIHIGDSSNVHIRNIFVRTGDDCISIGPGTSNVAINQVVCGPGHGISVGSLGESSSSYDVVSSVTVTGVWLTGTQNGVRIKTWPGGKGLASSITFQHIWMNQVQNPIIIDQQYCPHHSCSNSQASGVKIVDVLFKGISGTSATKNAITLACSKGVPCQGIRIENVNLSYGDKVAESLCKNAMCTETGFVKPIVTCY